jgi:hypothetical protein
MAPETETFKYHYDRLRDIAERMRSQQEPDLDSLLGFVPLLNFEWVTVHDDGSPRPGVKGGRSPAQRTLDAWNWAIRWSMAGCGAVTHPAIETQAVIG